MQLTLDTPINFANGYKFTVDVYSTVAREFTLKLVDASTDTDPVQLSANTTGAGWDTLGFDFTGQGLGPQSTLAFIHG